MYNINNFYKNKMTYLESIVISLSRRFKWSSFKWNKFNNATGGIFLKLFPLIDKYDKFTSFDSWSVGTTWKKKTNNMKI